MLNGITIGQVRLGSHLFDSPLNDFDGFGIRGITGFFCQTDFIGFGIENA